MKYWFDTEFIEQPFATQLVSIGMVAEDGREFYAENSEVDWGKATQWTLNNVRPHLTGPAMDAEEIGYAIRRFTDGDDAPVFWGYYCAFDWVCFCSLFGGLGELPFDYPQFCRDTRQWAETLGDPVLPVQADGKHNALADARWTRQIWEHLNRVALQPAG